MYEDFTIPNPLEMTKENAEAYYSEQQVSYETSPLKAIRAKCYDCTANQTKEIRNCVLIRCPLHPFRMGKNPFSSKKGNVSEEKRQELAERMKYAREQKYKNNNYNHDNTEES